MDRIKETADLLIDFNKYKNGKLEDFNFIKSVCSYYDSIKNETLNESDYKFLRYMANYCGVPHFYSILKQFNQNTEINSFDLNTFAAILNESSLHTDRNSMLHKYQKQILDKFEYNKLNRFFLSASTSFGKTHIVFEIIKKMNYLNVVLIFPTIALLSENLERILSDENYFYFKDNYEIHTLSEVKEFGEKNLFIYTPERYLSFVEKNQKFLKVDFAFIDEIYKIDNDYLLDEEVKENERDVAYRLAVFYTLDKDRDVLLAGPYMDFSIFNQPNYNGSFDNFLLENKILLIDYNDYEIVNKNYYRIEKHQSYPKDSQLNIRYSNLKKRDNLKETVKAIIDIQQNLIIYCSNRGKNGGVEYYAEELIDSKILNNHNYSEYEDFIDHISLYFSENWILVRSLKAGIGIHHGLIPKYIQKEVINLFNKGLIKLLISTTTITEGVNTSAKNIVVMHSKKGNKVLKKFDAKNIAGRAGRFGFHYSGRVFDLSNVLLNIINGKEEILKHKNYDINTPKEELDLFYSNEKYLSSIDIDRKKYIIQEQLKRGIPNEILQKYKVVSPLDKITIYDSILNLTESDFCQIRKLIKEINFRLNIDFDGFQIILKIIEPVIRNKKLKFLINNKCDENKYSTLTYLVYYYLKDGFSGSIKYKIDKGKTIDKAISDTADFVYNTLKYQTVKYLGVFNLMYKFHISERDNKKIDDIAGIDKLLLKFEYNAITDNGRIASDYGVPSRIIEYYEKNGENDYIKNKFDNYELESFEKVQKIILSKKH